MAVITPNTDLYLLKVPLEMDNVNQLTFSDATAQHNYFSSLPKLGVDDFTYQRKDGTIRFSANFDDVISYNYCMYRNTEYNDKWFYAFIENMQYVNDSVTLITIKTDVWQTWCFSLIYKPVFVEREHVNDDTIGANLVPENLETGEYVQNGIPLNFGFGTNLRYVINATYAPYDSQTEYLGVNNGGIPMAGNLFVFDYWQQMVNALQLGYSVNGTSKSIAQVYAVPYNSFDDNDLVLDSYDGTDDTAYYIYNGRNTPISRSVTLSIPSSIDGYVPHNNKLYTSPYQSILLTNNNGTVNSYMYEYFSNKDNIVFDYYAIPTVGFSALIYPVNYKNIEDNYNEGIIAGKYPTLSWSGDSYTNWLTQNAVNIGTGVISDIAKLPLIPYNPVVGIAGLATSIGNQVSELYQHSLVSQTISGNVNGGDAITGGRINDCYIYKMSITSKFAQIIDRHFDMFGYKVNTVKIPNITGRRNWNYVKTIGCYIDANIPQTDLEEIKSLFNNGITFWHNPATFADYTQNNDII